jgi:hypothetical protein
MNSCLNNEGQEGKTGPDGGRVLTGEEVKKIFGVVGWEASLWRHRALNSGLLPPTVEREPV